jgi:hypothetical protein
MRTLTLLVDSSFYVADLHMLWKNTCFKKLTPFHLLASTQCPRPFSSLVGFPVLVQLEVYSQVLNINDNEVLNTSLMLGESIPSLRHVVRGDRPPGFRTTATLSAFGKLDSCLHLTLQPCSSQSWLPDEEQDRTCCAQCRSGEIVPRLRVDHVLYKSFFDLAVLLELIEEHEIWKGGLRVWDTSAFGTQLQDHKVQWQQVTGHLGVDDPSEELSLDSPMFHPAFVNLQAPISQ